MVYMYEVVLIVGYILIALGAFISQVRRHTLDLLDLLMIGLLSFLWLPYAAVFGTVMGLYHVATFTWAHLRWRTPKLFAALRDRISYLKA